MKINWKKKFESLEVSYNKLLSEKRQLLNDVNSNLKVKEDLKNKIRDLSFENIRLNQTLKNIHDLVSSISRK